MTNQQGAPEALRPALIAAAQAVVDRWDTPLWKDVPATAEYIGRLRAALVEAQQPAPSAAVALSDDLRDRLVAISEAIADQDDRAAQAMLREILKAPQPSPTPQADSQPAPHQELVWDGKLSDTMQKALNALYLECSHEVARDVAFCVRQELEAIYTSYNTVKRMYGAARDRLEAMEATQPQPDSFAQAPADSGAAPAGGVVEQWRPMETAPKDGTLVRLLVEFEDNATEDGEGPQPTIGSNTADNTGEDIGWRFAGWNWTHDCYTQGVGKPVGWLPMVAPAPPAQAADSVLEDAARLTTEQEHAIRQGHEIAASDGYFEVRPQIDSNDRRRVFLAGFERGWDAARKQGGAA